MVKVRFGGREMEVGGKYLGTLREATDLLGDVPTLRARMQEDGYLLIRGLHDRSNVETTRRHIVSTMDASGWLAPAHDTSDAVAGGGPHRPLSGGLRALSRSDELVNLVEAPEIMGFFEHFLGGQILTYDYKWLRIVGPGDSTGAHYDVVYMGRGTRDLYTCWTPLGDLALEMGTLAILEGSHRFERVKETYGQVDVDRDNIPGWFTRDPVEIVDRHGGRWATAEFAMGDVLIFGMYTMHASLDNTSNRYRLSCDTRYQRADEPVDERWIGAAPKAHSVQSPGEPVSMEEMRRRWDV